MEKKWYVATFTGYGVEMEMERRWMPKIILRFTDLQIENGDYITSRFWSNTSKKLTGLKLEPGDQIRFQAKIQEHTLNTGQSLQIKYISDPGKTGRKKELK